MGPANVRPCGKGGFPALSKFTIGFPGNSRDFDHWAFVALTGILRNPEPAGTWALNNFDRTSIPIGVPQFLFPWHRITDLRR